MGSREQVNHIINGMYVRPMADRSQFSPLVPAPLAQGKYMSALLRQPN